MKIEKGLLRVKRPSAKVSRLVLGPMDKLGKIITLLKSLCIAFSLEEPARRTVVSDSRKVGIVITSFLLMVYGLQLVSLAAQPVLLQGSVRETAPVQEAADSSSRVFDRGGKPLSGVVISIPALNYHAVSDENGRFSLPALPGLPAIVLFEKAGFVPFSATLDSQRNGKRQLPIRITLQSIDHTLVLDTQIRHLGDNSYSPVSAGAADFRKHNDGPRFITHFVLSEKPATSILEIGSVIGLDTLEAHQQGQSLFHRYSSPMTIRLNGQILGHIAVNGDRHHLTVPPHILLQGMNTLQIETGFETPNGSDIDYDDMELMLITLRFP